MPDRNGHSIARLRLLLRGIIKSSNNRVMEVQEISLLEAKTLTPNSIGGETSFIRMNNFSITKTEMLLMQLLKQRRVFK
jgi:hypothetical protein